MTSVLTLIKIKRNSFIWIELFELAKHRFSSSDTLEETLSFWDADTVKLLEFIGI